MVNGVVPSRRRFLAGIGTASILTTAGCFDAVLGSSSGEIEPEEPSDPREGTPGEFYTLIERNELSVDSLYRDDTDLILTYHSNATTVEESIEEMGIIVTVFDVNLVQNDTDLEMLICEIVDPIEGQAHGWGVKTSWVEEVTEGTMSEDMLFQRVLNMRVYEDDIGDPDS